MLGKQYRPATHPPLILIVTYSAPIFMNAIRKNIKTAIKNQE